jgi:hypothetical protein
MTSFSDLYGKDVVVYTLEAPEHARHVGRMVESDDRWIQFEPPGGSPKHLIRIDAIARIEFRSPSEA